MTNSKVPKRSKLQKIPALREGDTIAIVAPSGPVPKERFEAGLARLQRHFQVKVECDIFRREGFLAGDDRRRAEEFNRALADPNVRAIWAARGGYGAARIIPFLDCDAMRKTPKVLVGFSDITVLLCWAAKLGYRSMHAPVVTQLGELGDLDCQWAVDMLLGRLDGALLGEGLSGHAPNTEGVLLGGNLSILAHLCGTDLAPEYRESLCVLEDVGERSYAIDRYLTQLFTQQRGALEHANAVLLGDFEGCGSPEIDAVDTAVKHFLGRDMACVRGLSLGHGLRNRAFPFGANAKLEGGKLWLIDSVVDSVVE